jgi:NADH dehydrogenase FAD-containing subunit
MDMLTGILTFRADNFEIASLPTTSPEERKRLLSFVICGGGPTGVETAAVGIRYQ